MSSDILSKLYRTRDLSSLNIEEKEILLGYALLIPSGLLIMTLVLWPLLYNVYLSFTEVPLDPALTAEIVGLDHYQETLSDDQFWAALKESVVYTAFSSFFATAIGLGVALLLRRSFRGERLVRAVTLLPYIMPVIAAAFVWRWMAHPTYGAIPDTLANLGLVSSDTDLIRNPSTAMPALIVFDTWRYYPFAFLMIIARVRSIPTEMYEAAKIDGAGAFARFKDITLPELKFVLAAVVLLRVIWNFNAFTQVWLFTPAVEVLPVYTFLTAFQQFDLGQGAAISVILLLFQMTFVFIYVRWALEW